MGLRAVFAEALPGIFIAAGEPAVFTPASGAPVDCMVFIDFNVKLQPGGTMGQVVAQATTIEALLDDPRTGGTGVAIGREPNRGETFTVYPDETSRTAGTGGTLYTVASPLENDKLTSKVVVT